MKSINISVIVPVLNEEDNIIFFLNSLINQTLKPNEIIICDGGSTDKTLSLIRDFQINNKEIILTKEKSICRGSGRNIAIKQSKSNYIALIDAGTYADKFWLERMANIIVSKDSIDIIFGVVKPIINNNFDLSLSTVILGKYYDNYLLIPTVASILLKKESLEIIGYFPTNAKGKYVVEDLIFLNNIKKSKLNFILAFIKKLFTINEKIY